MKIEVGHVNLKIVTFILLSILILDCHRLTEVVDAANGYEQNLKQEHKEFKEQEVRINVKSGFELNKRPSPYSVMAGTIIPGVLVTGMNSDLPGTVIGQVSQNVYDSIKGKYLLIPQGSKIIGIYDTNTAYAQTRGAVIWQRLILPNGEAIILPNLDGTDEQGYVGFKDKVRSHYARVVWSSMIGGAIVAATASLGDSDSEENSFETQMGAQVNSNLSGAVNSIVNKNLNIAPTVIIRPGYKFNIIVDKDLVFKPYSEDEDKK